MKQKKPNGDYSWDNSSHWMRSPVGIGVMLATLGLSVTVIVLLILSWLGLR